MPFSRRDFLRLSGAALAGLALPGAGRGSRAAALSPDWPKDVSLGRVTPVRIRLIARPHPDGRRLDYRYEDDVLVVLREVVGEGFYPHNHVWFETPDGYAYSSWVQPARADFNEPPTEILTDGLYVELTVPYTNAREQPDPAASVVYRLYHGSAYHADAREGASDGSVWYRINDENGVRMYGQATHFRPIAPEEFAPISPQVEDKTIVVSLGLQSLSAYEGEVEVFRARLSSGRDYFGPDGTTLGSLTPAGVHPIWSKRASRHMTGGTPENGYDLPGVPWVTYFSGHGEAIHGTYWHNDFGAPKSAGCLNVRPEDAKWLFRWTLPVVPYVPGYIIVEWPGGTRVVIED